MVMVKDNDCIPDEVTAMITQHITGAELDQNVGSELSYILPDNEAKNFPAMFTELEAKQDKLRIQSYGLSVTTMDEVFFK